MTGKQIKLSPKETFNETGSNWLQITARKGDNQSKMPYNISNSRLDYKKGKRNQVHLYQYALRYTIYHFQTASSFLKQKGNGGPGTLTLILSPGGTFVKHNGII